MVTTAIPLNTSLYVPPPLFGELCRMVHGSGVVDNLMMWDQITNFWPPHLWTPANTPLAEVLPDIDSYGDAFTMAAYAMAAAPGAGLVVSTDAIRRGPVELNQTMWTLASMAGGKAIFQVGAGEAKQTDPGGWNGPTAWPGSRISCSWRAPSGRRRNRSSTRGTSGTSSTPGWGWAGWRAPRYGRSAVGPSCSTSPPATPTAPPPSCPASSTHESASPSWWHP